MKKENIKWKRTQKLKENEKEKIMNEWRNKKRGKIIKRKRM